jgi:hypothetical protein
MFRGETSAGLFERRPITYAAGFGGHGRADGGGTGKCLVSAFHDHNAKAFRGRVVGPPKALGWPKDGDRRDRDKWGRLIRSALTFNPRSSEFYWHLHT